MIHELFPHTPLSWEGLSFWNVQDNFLSDRQVRGVVHLSALSVCGLHCYRSDNSKIWSDTDSV